MVLCLAAVAESDRLSDMHQVSCKCWLVLGLDGTHLCVPLHPGVMTSALEALDAICKKYDGRESVVLAGKYTWTFASRQVMLLEMPHAG